MPTVIAPSRIEQAARLRAEFTDLSQEVSQLRGKLEMAQRALGALQEKRHKFTEDAARGKQPQPSEIATLTAEINAAQIPFEGLTALVNSKQAALDQVRTSLETLDCEIAAEARQAALQARFDSLKKKGGEVVARIGETLRILIEHDLSEYDQVRDALHREFIAVGTQPLAAAAREVVAQFGHDLFDGPFLRVGRQLLREGWEVRGDVAFEIKNLRRTKQ